MLTYEIVVHVSKCIQRMLNFRLTKRSWFGALMGSTEKEEHHFVMIKDRAISQIKADLVHAFLCVSTLKYVLFFDNCCAISFGKVISTIPIVCHAVAFCMCSVNFVQQKTELPSRRQVGFVKPYVFM